MSAKSRTSRRSIKVKKKSVGPFTQRPKKKYPFPTPIRPCTVVRVKASPNKKWKVNIGRRFRVGYYSWQDGLDCIWLVNDSGKYEQTVDHEFLYKFFEIETLSRERSLYGRNRPRLGPVSLSPTATGSGTLH